MLYDDVLSATTLVGVSAVMAAVFVGVAGEPQQATAQRVANRQVGTQPVVQVRPEPVAAMPIHELPRVVVKANRSRDGDLVATTQTQPVGSTAQSRKTGP